MVGFMFAKLSVTLDWWHFVALICVGVAALCLRWGIPKLMNSGIHGLKLMGTATGLVLSMYAGWWGYKAHEVMTFNSRFDDYVVASWNASDPATAVKYMNRAAKWVEDNNVLDGPEQTAVLYEGAEYNVHDWALKVIALNAAITALPHEEIPLAKRRTLVKQNEELNPWQQLMLDSGLVSVSGDRPSVSSPPGICLYPHNFENLVFSGVTGIVSALLGLTTFGIHVRRRRKKVESVCNFCGNIPTGGTSS